MTPSAPRVLLPPQGHQDCPCWPQDVHGISTSALQGSDSCCYQAGGCDCDTSSPLPGCWAAGHPARTAAVQASSGHISPSICVKKCPGSKAIFSPCAFSHNLLIRNYIYSVEMKKFGSLVCYFPASSPISSRDLFLLRSGADGWLSLIHI